MEPVIENSGYFYFTSAPSVMPGDILTIKAGTIIYGPASLFNPQATQTFTGEMYLAGSSLEQIGVLIPEPSTGLLCLVAMAAMGRRRRSRVADTSH